MDPQAYPGKGLSLSQLLFALNEELKHAMGSPSLTFDKVSRLGRDATDTLVTVREWRNSFIHINRIPSKVLSQISTHLPSQRDCFRATFVCRHWRKNLLRHAGLWSELYLRKGETYVKTLLQRARESPLDIVSFYPAPISVITLLPPHAKKIKSLRFEFNYWADIRKFLEINPGPLPLLHTLEINFIEEISSDAMIPPSLLFSNAVDLREFQLGSTGSPFLNSFVFPNLTSFRLSITQVGGFRASQLLDFLEASLMLQVVNVEIVGDILFDDIPRERAVVLPNLKSLSLAVSDGKPGYDLATYISCPSVKYTPLSHKKDVGDLTLYNIFPSPALWCTIVRQYTRSPIENVALKMNMTQHTVLKCELIFSSPDTTRIVLYFEVTKKDRNKNEDDFETPLHEIYCGVFSQACRIIRDLPRPANVKRLYIAHSPLVSEYTRVTPIASELGRLFESLGPLRWLELSCCDMRPYLVPSLTFPRTEHLRISYPLYPPHEDAEAAIVGLAESQHALGVPFKSVAVDMGERSAEVAKRLGLCVGTARRYEGCG